MQTFASGATARFSETSLLPCSKTPLIATLGILVVVAGISGFPAGARAQINPFQGYRGPSLSRPDLDAGRAAAGRLLEPAPKPVGSAEKWTGPTSGNSGSLKIERAYMKRGSECRAVRSDISYKAGSSRSFVFQVCRVGGRWRLAD